jgi:CRP/FNR family transcriptional regulator, cyclic AMP receptor protein
MIAVKHLKKGDLLMREGETSNSMYWVQSGTLRLFKKKGSGFIELGVVHSGEVVGDMSFLDSQPRSASVEALQPCDIIEIPRGKFDEFINTQPSWMKSLVQTLVKRLRGTNNRLREIESSSTVYSRDDDGKTTKIHEFLSTADTLKLCSSLLLAYSRNQEKAADGTPRVKAGWLQFYGSQIFGVHLSKIQVFTDVLNEMGLIRIEKNKDIIELVLLEIDRLEKYIYFCHEENSKTEDKQLPITLKGLAVLHCVGEFSAARAHPNDEKLSVNMQEVFEKAAAAKNLKIPFDWSAFDELVKAGFTSEVRASGAEKNALVNVPRFLKIYPLLALRQKIREINEQKREN